jgi:hypothetical protein
MGKSFVLALFGLGVQELGKFFFPKPDGTGLHLKYCGNLL